MVLIYSRSGKIVYLTTSSFIIGIYINQTSCLIMWLVVTGNFRNSAHPLEDLVGVY